MGLMRLCDVRRIAATLAILLWSVVHAYAPWIWYTYSQWERLPDEMKMAYLGGASDSLLEYATNEQEQAMSTHYSDCLERSHMNLHQLTVDIEAFARTRPELQGRVFQSVLVEYLNSFCSPPPQ
jgi:hypothetical protein